jgi:hypothetical protein
MVKKKKKVSVELTLWDVILSYPDLHDPKPFKGKIYYKTDVLLDADHSQLGELRKAITKVRVGNWGEDKDEWPKGAKKVFIQKGDEREDSQGYKGRLYFTTATQSPVPVIDPKGKAFNPQMVKGGMFANVAVNISPWMNGEDEGLSIYLQGVQIDTSKAGLNFGGGRSVKKMFDLDNGDGEDDNMDRGEEDDTPRGKRGKSKNFDDSEE